MQIWFACGSQHLYGPAALRVVWENAQRVAEALDQSEHIPLAVAFHGVLTTPEEIDRLLAEASANPTCAGLIFWMHTFSPAKMWIRGLKALTKPFLHLHTQFHRDLPWGEIDMDFMNLHQAAHGDREFGFVCTRLRLERKVVVGHWADAGVQKQIGCWVRAARARHDWQGARFIRFGDNMRQVAVTEGDKVAAEEAFGFSVNGYGVGDLAARIREVREADIAALVAQYAETYDIAPELRPGAARHETLREAGRIEAGLRAFLEETDARGFTTTFEDLHGLRQLPGLAVQRLMAEGYGFGAEGDWKTAALLRAVKVMEEGLTSGTSFMEDYTYHLESGRELVLGAHMLEVCPTIASGRPRVEAHPLGIGGREDPARLVFDGRAGPARNVSLVDLGDRFRLIVNEVRAVEPPEPLPRLPVARAVWVPQPNFADGCAAWILAGGAHHTAYTLSVPTEALLDFARMFGLEVVEIGEGTTLEDIREANRC